MDTKLDKIVSLCKRRGFIFPGSEIYGGLANSWDYGPLGVELKNNIRDWWWKRFVQSRDDMVGIDAAVLMNPRVWEASGHLKEFSDPLVECKKCHKRFREDQIDESNLTDNSCTAGQHEFHVPKQFNLMFKTFVGTTDESASAVYLRPELAQAMFVNFQNVLNTSRKKLPFGIASIGKAFRNEITPGNFVFRTLEFDLMEFEYFVSATDWKKYFEYWLAQQQAWLSEIGLKSENLRLREHQADERAHYSLRTVDVEYNTPFGWKEMFGLAYRTDFDLKKHTTESGQDMRYTDPETNEKFVPHVIEPTFGLTRLLLMILLDSYQELGAGQDTHTVLKLHPRLAPYKMAVFPLVKNKPEIVQKAKAIYKELRADFMVAWDDRGNIGKRYFSQDEIGTPYCVTVDYQTLEDGTVTVRDRDTMKQERIDSHELKKFISHQLEK